MVSQAMMMKFRKANSGEVKKQFSESKKRVLVTILVPSVPSDPPWTGLTTGHTAKWQLI